MGEIQVFSDSFRFRFKVFQILSDSSGSVISASFSSDDNTVPVGVGWLFLCEQGEMRGGMALLAALCLLLNGHGDADGLRVASPGRAILFRGGAAANEQLMTSRTFEEGTFSQGVAVSMRLKFARFHSGPEMPNGVGNIFGFGSFNEEEGRSEQLLSVLDWGGVSSLFYGQGLLSSIGNATFNIPGKPAKEEEGENPWHHAVFSVDFVKQELGFFQELGTGRDRVAKYAANSSQIEWGHFARVKEILATERTFFSLGYGSPSTSGLTAEIDDLCVFNYSLDRAQILGLAEFGCSAAPSSVLHHDFDDAKNGRLWDHAVERYTSTYLQSAILADGSGIESVCVHAAGGTSQDHPLPPVLIGSSAPIEGAFASIVAPSITSHVNDNNSTQAVLQCLPECDSVLIASIPSSGTLYFSGVPIESAGQTFLLGSNVSAVKNLTYVGEGIGGGWADAFAVRVGRGTQVSRNTTVRVTSNSAPTLRNAHTEYWVDPSQPGKMAFGIHLPPEVEYWLDADGSAGATQKVQITHVAGDAFIVDTCNECYEKDLWPESFYYYSSDGEQDEPGENSREITLPFQEEVWLNSSTAHQPLVISFNPSHTDRETNITYRIFDGFDFSNEAVLRLSANIPNQPPLFKFDGQVQAREDELAVVNLTAYMSDPEGDAMWLQVTQAPRNGTLFQGDRAVVVGEKADQPIVQYVAESSDNKASDCWDDACPWGLWALAGASDNFPDPMAPVFYPSGRNENPWLIVNFEQKVFPKALLLFERWSPGGLVMVEAEFEGSGWTRVWSGKTSYGMWCPHRSIHETCDTITRYELCNMPGLTSKLRLSFHMPIGLWVGLEAIAFEGWLESRSDIVPAGEAGEEFVISYKPNGDFHGLDGFHLTPLDCNADLSSAKLLRASEKRVNVTVAPVFDPPEIWFASPDENHQAAQAEERGRQPQGNVQARRLQRSTTNRLPIYVRDPDGFDKSHQLQVQLESDHDVIGDAVVYISDVFVGRHLLWFGSQASILAIESTWSSQTQLGFDLEVHVPDCSSQGLFRGVVKLSVSCLEAAAGREELQPVTVETELAIEVDCSDFKESGLYITGVFFASLLLGVGLIFLATKAAAVLKPNMQLVSHGVVSPFLAVVIGACTQIFDMTSNFVYAFELFGSDQVSTEFASVYFCFCTFALLGSFYYFGQALKLTRLLLQEVRRFRENSNTEDHRIGLLRRQRTLLYYTIQSDVSKALVSLVEDVPILVLNLWIRVVIAEKPSIAFAVSTYSTLFVLGQTTYRVVRVVATRRSFYEVTELLAFCKHLEEDAKNDGNLAERLGVLVPFRIRKDQLSCTVVSSAVGYILDNVEEVKKGFGQEAWTKSSMLTPEMLRSRAETALQFPDWLLQTEKLESLAQSTIQSTITSVSTASHWGGGAITIGSFSKKKSVDHQRVVPTPILESANEKSSTQAGSSCSGSKPPNENTTAQ